MLLVMEELWWLVSEQEAEYWLLFDLIVKFPLLGK
jgi:hypothetical protein